MIVKNVVATAAGGGAVFEVESEVELAESEVELAVSEELAVQKDFEGEIEYEAVELMIFAAAAVQPVSIPPVSPTTCQIPPSNW